uniref:Uncharacterized protein n=1 Tax=Anopheles atroparvus TaxID=41427 RepID=A0A182J3U0_ANOAO
MTAAVGLIIINITINIIFFITFAGSGEEDRLLPFSTSFHQNESDRPECLQGLTGVRAQYLTLTEGIGPLRGSDYPTERQEVLTGKQRLKNRATQQQHNPCSNSAYSDVGDEDGADGGADDDTMISHRRPRAHNITITDHMNAAKTIKITLFALAGSPPLLNHTSSRSSRTRKSPVRIPAYLHLRNDRTAYCVALRSVCGTVGSDGKVCSTRGPTLLTHCALLGGRKQTKRVPNRDIGSITAHSLSAIGAYQREIELKLHARSLRAQPVHARRGMNAPMMGLIAIDLLAPSHCSPLLLTPPPLMLTYQNSAAADAADCDNETSCSRLRFGTTKSRTGPKTTARSPPTFCLF